MAAFFFILSVLGLYMHYRIMEGASAKIRRLESEMLKLEKDNLRLGGRLESQENSLNLLRMQLEESERIRRELVLQREAVLQSE